MASITLKSNYATKTANISSEHANVTSLANVKIKENIGIGSIGGYFSTNGSFAINTKILSAPAGYRPIVDTGLIMISTDGDVAELNFYANGDIINGSAINATGGKYWVVVGMFYC